MATPKIGTNQITHSLQSSLIRDIIRKVKEAKKWLLIIKNYST